MSKQILINTFIFIVAFLLGVFLAMQLQPSQTQPAVTTTAPEIEFTDVDEQVSGPLTGYTIESLFTQHECLLNERDVVFLCFDGTEATLLTYSGKTLTAPGVIEEGVLKLSIEDEDVSFHIIEGYLFEEYDGVFYDKGAAHLPNQ